MIKNDNKINLFVIGSARSLNVTKIQEFNDEQAVLIRIYFSFFVSSVLKFTGIVRFQAY